ncbi:hypothetical protein TNCV_415071 [Trichonephila clavipes]|nr:hypothetical protein TNCV_415071 [Trichonephila clavipes]
MRNYDFTSRKPIDFSRSRTRKLDLCGHTSSEPPEVTDLINNKRKLSNSVKLWTKQPRTTRTLKVRYYGLKLCQNSSYEIVLTHICGQTINQHYYVEVITSLRGKKLGKKARIAK